MPNCRSVLSVCSGVYRRARGRSGDRIVMRTSSENDDSHIVDFDGLSISLPPIRPRADIGVAGPHLETTPLTKIRMSGTADSTKMCAISMGLSMSEMHALSTAPSMSRIGRFSSLPCYELQPDIRHPHGNLGLASPLEVFDIDNVVNDDTLRWSDTDYGTDSEAY